MQSDPTLQSISYNVRVYMCVFHIITIFLYILKTLGYKSEIARCLGKSYSFPKYHTHMVTNQHISAQLRLVTGWSIGNFLSAYRGNSAHVKFDRFFPQGLFWVW